jgi:phosphate starvation-inducible PhoH-like protein
MFLTRMGRNAKFIVTGDLTQVDLPRQSDSGLTMAVERLEKVDGIGVIKFGKGDIIRHPLVKHIVDALADHPTKKEDK